VIEVAGGAPVLETETSELGTVIENKRILEFRAEFFNLPNHPIFNPPGRQLRTSTYGAISGTKIDSRQVQFGLKLHF
jgi:hypothetical protein